MNTTAKGKCIPARGALDAYGYGRIKVKGRLYGAHRYAWIQAHGEIPAGKVIDHLCRNRGCINVAHMELVTTRENVLRGIGHAAVNARKTHCNRGHEFTKANTRIDEKGKRLCKICRAAIERKYQRRKRLSKEYA